MRAARTLLSLALMGCLRTDDVVATPAIPEGAPDTSACCDGAGPALDDAGAARDNAAAALDDAAAAIDDGVPLPALACQPGHEDMALLTKQGHLFRVRPDGMGVTDRGVPTCLLPGWFAVAVDRHGTIWVAPQDGTILLIDPKTLECSKRDLNLKASTMTFVFDPETAQERLYALENGVLVAVDPEALKRTSIGALQARSLSGSRDGALFALTEEGGEVVTIARVDLANAAATVEWKAVRPSAPFAGGALGSGNFVLFFERDVYGFWPPTGDTQLIGQLPPDGEGLISVGSAVCSAGLK
jgi:hypothetical protein